MKTAVYDVGSNSIRLVVFDVDSPILKRKINCRLGEGVAENEILTAAAIKRAFAAFSVLKELAASQGVREGGHFAFLTEAVRRAANGKEFLRSVEETFLIKCELLSGQQEAEIGLNGVLGGSDGAVLDIGGGSSELCVRAGGKIVYAKSVKVGAGILRDMFSGDGKGLSNAVKGFAGEFCDAPPVDLLYAIGGTATGCAYVFKRLFFYDERLIHGSVLFAKEVSFLAEELLLISDDERAERYALDENRAKVLPYGAKLFAQILEVLRPNKVVVSERGNVEGYFAYLVRTGRVDTFDKT